MKIDSLISYFFCINNIPLPFPFQTTAPPSLKSKPPLNSMPPPQVHPAPGGLENLTVKIKESLNREDLSHIFVFFFHKLMIKIFLRHFFHRNLNNLINSVKEKYLKYLKDNPRNNRVFNSIPSSSLQLK